MYEDLIRKVEQKAEILTKKSGLKQTPKLRVVKGTTGVNSNTNVLAIDEYLLSQWQDGEISEIDIDGTLAHEFGHLIEHSTDKLGRKSDRQLVFYIMVLAVALIFYYALQIPEPGIGYPVITLIWVALLPFISRKICVPGELAADRNAVYFSLITDQEMANCIVNRIGRFPKKRPGPMEVLKIVDNFVTHPFLKEQLENIGFEIERPIKTKQLKDC